MHRHLLLHKLAKYLLSGAWLFAAALASAQQPAPAQDANVQGPIRLRQPGTQGVDATGQPGAGLVGTAYSVTSREGAGAQRRATNTASSEFEEHVRQLAGRRDIARFGANLLSTPDSSAEVQEVSPQVPDDYLLQPGDELVINLWGSIDADLRLEVDRTGRINIPRVGAVMVAGTRYSGVTALIASRAGQVFKNFQVSAVMGRLRGIRVYMTGYISKPGPLAVSSLSSVLTALSLAGGPNAAGSLRHVQLRRGREAPQHLDLYDVLLKGDRSGDRLLQADDVIYVGPVGPQVALIGSVNQPAIFELKSGEALADVLRMAGGFSPVADRSRLSMERVGERSTVRVTELMLPADAAARLESGDVLRVLSVVDYQVPVQLKHKRVRIEGEVQRPGEYVLPAESNLQDGLKAAGGLTASAYVFATDFSRVSVRQTQQENYDRALRDLETEITRMNSTRRTASADDAAALAARSTGNDRLVDRLRQIKPNGRIVLELPVDATILPPLVLEDGDRIYVPPRAATVGVFGSVYNAGSYLFTPGRLVQDYTRLAGGPTKGADIGSAIVVRANGSVVNVQHRGGWLRRDDGLGSIRAEAGDTVFVPEELDKTTWAQSMKDWTQIIYNLGLGAAAIKAVFN